MSFKKNLIIYALLVVMIMCCISATSAEDSSDITLLGGDVDDIGTVRDVVDDNSAEDVVASDSSNELLGDDEEVTIYVDSTYDGEIEDGTLLNPYKTISGAINGVSTNKSTIFIKNGIYTENEITLPDKEISFVGESVDGVTILSKASNKYAFTGNLKNKDLFFYNLTFKNSNSAYGLNIGGDGDLIISNCIFDNFYCRQNTDTAFKFATTTSTIKDSEIISIQSTRSSQGYILYNSGNHTIKNCIINRSAGSTNINIGIFNVATTAVLDINNLTVSNTGIAKSIIQNAGKVRIKNSNFINNVIKSGTGLFYNNNGYLTIESSVISDNSGFNYLIYENGENSNVTIKNTALNNNKYTNALLKDAGANDLNGNWWGTNEKPNAIVGTWVIMDTSISKNVEEVTVTADFTKYTDGNNTYDLEKLLPDFPVSFKSSNLTLNDKIYTKNGVATAKFRSNDDFQVSIEVGSTYTYNLGDIYVDCNFNGTELGTSDNPYKSIYKAVDAATGWETIHIKNGNYSEDSPITLMNSLIFVGESKECVIITGSNKGIFNNPFFMSKNILLSFNNLTIKDVACSGNYAPFSIRSSVSNLTLNNCIFDNCSSQYGSMNIASANAVISNCEIKNSKLTSTSAGTIYFSNNGTYEINRLVITNISAIDSSVDGVIVCKEGGSVITIDNLAISNVNNTATVIYSNGKITIKNSEIQNINLEVSDDSIGALIYSGSNLISTSVTVSDVNCNNVYYIEDNSIVDSITGSISNIECGAVFSAGYGSTFKSVSASVSNVNCSCVFKICGNSTVSGISSRVSNVDCDSLFVIGENSTITSTSTISDVDCLYIFYLGANSNITFDQGAILNSNVNKTVFYNLDNTSSTIANFNIFLNNNISQFINGIGSFDLDFNWWETNEKPNDYVTNWVIMDAYTTKSGGSITITVLFKGFNGNRSFELEKNVHSGIPITIVSSSGNYNGTIYSVDNKRNTAKFAIADNIYVNITSGEANITVSTAPVTYYVDSNYEGEEKGTFENPFKTLMAAINVAGDGDSIFLKKGKYNFNDYSKAISFIGESRGDVLIELTGNKQFSIGGNSLPEYFINLTISCTSALRFNAGKINFINCSFDNFVVNGRLNPIQIYGSQILVENCNFTNFKHTTMGTQVITFYGSTILKNVVIDNYVNSGLLTPNHEFLHFYSGIVDIDNLTISNCEGTVNRGMIHSSATQVNIKNSKIINNSMQVRSLIYGNNINIESSIISNNSKFDYFIEGNVKINFNILSNNLYNNGLSYDNNGNLDNNWWGTNEIINSKVNQWAILSADISPDVVVGEPTNITVSITKYITKDGVIGDLTSSIPVDGTEVTITSPSSEVTTAVLKDSKFTFPYTTTENNNTFNIKCGDVEFNYTVPIKVLRIDLGNVSIVDGADITILAPGVNANITLIIDGVSETVEINNTLTKTIKDLKAGTHSVVAIYIEGSSFNFDSKSFIVEKLPTEITAQDVSINVGEFVTLNINLGENVTGRVYFDLSGKKSFEDLVNGETTFDIKDLAFATYTLTISYDGDANYLPSEKTINITINGFEAGLKANTSDIKVGQDAVISIEINKDVTGQTTVTISDLIVPVVFTDGKATVSIPDLANGTYTAVVKFAGDDKFFADEINVTFNVAKEEIPSDINVSMDIPEGTTAPEFSINLSKDATGNFTVYVDGTPYTQELVNGSATVKVPEQKPGNHTISTEYSGDEKYEGFKSDNSTINVPKATVPGGENALNIISPANSATPSYSINLPGATGNLTVTVDGKDKYTKALENGSATVIVPELTSGKHDITVTYSGDDKYASISKSTTVDVPAKSNPSKPVVKPKATKITAKNKKFKANKKVKKYTITLKSGKAPVKKVIVTIKIGKKTYKAKTNAKGKATFKIKKLTKKGTYKAVIKFKGTKNYKASSKKVKIKVKK